MFDRLLCWRTSLKDCGCRQKFFFSLSLSLRGSGEYGRTTQGKLLLSRIKIRLEKMDLCLRNETSVSPECVGAQTEALQSGGNGSLETSSMGSNLSAALIPQRMREKGEWTPLQLEPSPALQICPKHTLFCYKTQTSIPNKEENTTNECRHRSEEGSLMHWDDCWYLCFFLNHALGGKCVMTGFRSWVLPDLAVSCCQSV